MCRGGLIDVGGREVRITRVHLEEDTGKLLHAGDALHTAAESLVDLNRSGVPLMEIVTEPDLHSAEDARDYAMALRAILRAIGASEAEMEKGQLRAEANVSVRRRGSDQLGVKTELKNINSFRALHRAVDHEIRRQVELLEAGGQVVQETRGWSEAEQRTFSQRSKEYAQDYRYFPEPDLPPLELDPAWVESMRGSLPELPAARRARLAAQYAIPEYDAGQLTEEVATADLFESAVAAGAPAKQVSNWIMATRPTLDGSRLAELVGLVVAGTINRDQGVQVLEEAQATGRTPAEIVGERGLSQVSDEAELLAIVDRVIEESPQAAADVRAGKLKAIGPLVGKVVSATGGRANAKVASELLRKRLVP
jgi:aspartyl-tRNA(Asn)/glutamyl-tRNA(Gln) amidotransferase subunit B